MSVIKYCFITALFILTACSADDVPSVDVKKRNIAELKTAVQNFRDAYIAADVGRLQNLLTSDYLHTNPDGQVITRDSWLNWVASRREEIDNGQLIIDTYQISQLNIRLLSNRVAVVDGMVDSGGRQNNALFENRIKFTNVWLKEADGWKRTVFHDSRVAD